MNILTNLSKSKLLLPLCGVLALSTSLQAGSDSVDSAIEKIRAIKADDKRLAAFDKLADVIIEKNRKLEALVAKWHVGLDADSTTFTLYSTDLKATVAFALDKGELSFYVYGPNKLTSSKVGLSVDSSKLAFSEWNGSGGRLALHPKPKKLLELFKGKKSLILQVKSGSNSIETYKFVLSQFSSISAKLEKEGSQ